jgi:23S rRNA (guanosine2251-2'-O)-methyltransferase
MSRPDHPSAGPGHRPGQSGTKISGPRPTLPPFILYWGIHPVLEILKTRPQQLRDLYITGRKPSARQQEIMTHARQQRIRIHADPAAFAGTLQRYHADQVVHQGVLALGDPFPILTLADLIAAVQTDPQSFPSSTVVALDSLQDPQNVGAIMRSALAAGVAGIVIAKDRAAPLRGAVAKASAGAIAHLRVCQVTNLPAALQQLKKAGLWVFGTAKDADLSLYDADFSGPVCLVIGSEEKGLRPLVRKQCDFLVSIPMHGGLDSLNASTAAAVVLFEIVRQRVLRH